MPLYCHIIHTQDLMPCVKLECTSRSCSAVDRKHTGARDRGAHRTLVAFGVYHQQQALAVMWPCWL